MLVITPRAGEVIVVTCPGGERIVVRAVVELHQRRRIAIEAPANFRISREPRVIPREPREGGGSTGQ